MAESQKGKLLKITLLVLLGIVVVETGLILYNTKKGQGLCPVKSIGKAGAADLGRYFTPEWNPFQEMTQMRERINRMIDESFSRALVNPAFQGMSEQFAYFEPDVDITETDKTIVVRCDIPGLEKEKIDVQIQNNYLTLRGTKSLTSEMQEASKGFFRKERHFGSFTKSILLPKPVDETQSKASYENGVLTVEIPKLVPEGKAEKPSKIAIT